MLARGWPTALVICCGAATSIAILTQACMEPTQVTLDIEFRGGSCSEVTDIVIVVGDDPQTVEARTNAAQVFPTAVTQTCNGGDVGTLVLTPSESGSNRAAILVVAGLGVKAETCKAANGYLGCIVARRQVAFIENKPLFLPVVLERTCANVPCDASSSCKDGRCATSNVTCTGEACSDFGVTADGRPAIVSGAPTSPPNKEALCPSAGKPPTCGDLTCVAGQRCCYPDGPTILRNLTPRAEPTAGTSSGLPPTSSGGITSGGITSSGGVTSGGITSSGGMTSGNATSSGAITSSAGGPIGSSSGTLPPIPSVFCGASCNAGGIACYGRANCTPDAPFCCYTTPPMTSAQPSTTCQPTPCPTGQVVCHENCDCPDGMVCETREIGPDLHQCIF